MLLNITLETIRSVYVSTPVDIQNQLPDQEHNLYLDALKEVGYDLDWSHRLPSERTLSLLVPRCQKLNDKGEFFGFHFLNVHFPAVRGEGKYRFIYPSIN